MNHAAQESVGCGCIILALGLTLGWTTFVAGIVSILEAMK